MKIECIWRGPNALGEGPMWHSQEEALYWVDIENPSLHRLIPKTQHYQRWEMSDYIGAVVPRKKGGVVVTVGNKVFGMDIPSGKMTPLAEIKPWDNTVRMNDGKCDRRGRFWVGVAHFDPENPKGGLYRLDRNGALTQMEHSITISNGLGWSPDNKIFYYTDGLRYCIYQYDFDLDTGSLSNRRVFVQLEKSPIEPDGLTVDAEGFVWQAQWNGGRIVRYAPNGQVDQVVDMPVTRPTSCIFGGPNYDILYVTTCSRGIGEKEILPEPAGALFAIYPGVKGIPEPEFSG